MMITGSILTLGSIIVLIILAIIDMMRASKDDATNTSDQPEDRGQD